MPFGLNVLSTAIGAVIGGVLALIGTWITLRRTKEEKEEEECRQLIPLFYFLNSKTVILISFLANSRYVPYQQIISEAEYMDARNRLGYASRALSIREIGEIDSFCSYLTKLEEARNDCIKTRRVEEKEIYDAFLKEATDFLDKRSGSSGINEIGKKLEYYFSIVLADAYKGTQMK